MRFVWIYILSMVIALTSVASERLSVEFSEEQIASLQSIPAWETDSIRFSESKHSEKYNHIAQDFVPIVIISDQWAAPTNFYHYISLYRLVREKEYFLLI